jgi:hypothetical protein
LAQNWNVSEGSHYATSDLDASFSPWPLESLAPGKVRQDRANGQRPKAASFLVTAVVEINRLNVMALRLHQEQQSLVLVLLGIGSKPRSPKLQFGYQRQLQQARDLARPIPEVELES